MNKIKNDLYNDFWDWLDSVSIKYKNYEIKNAIIANKNSQYIRFMYYINHFNLRRFLSSIKWKLKLNLLTNKMPNQNMVLKRNYDSIYDLCNKNLYAINFSPNDSRNFLHIAPLVENDKKSLVITVRDDVYEYFNKIGVQSILLDVYNPWRKIRDLKIQIQKSQIRKNLLLSLDIFSLVTLSRAASLIDLLDIVTNENSLPQTLITLQDFQTFDSVFATYYTGKIPTITLQHGKSDLANKEWKYLISDWMIVFGARQAEILKSLGVNYKKIKILGTAKYDLYIDKIGDKLGNNKNKRVLLGIQQTMFFKENNEIIFDFIKEILPYEEDYTISIRFHPAIIKKDRKKFVKKLNLNYGVKVDISNIEDPLEDISKSDIVLVSSSGLAMEAILFKKPVIEYLSKMEKSVKYGDYRDFSLHAFKGKDAKALIIKLFNDEDFYNKIIEKQNKFVNKEISLPPAIPRILEFIEFINSLRNNKRSVKNNQ